MDSEDQAPFRFDKVSDKVSDKGMARTATIIANVQTPETGLESGLLSLMKLPVIV